MKAEAELLRVEEMDQKIEALIKKTTQYKSDFFKVDRQFRDVQAENDTLRQNLQSLESSQKGLHTILKTTE